MLEKRLYHRDAQLGCKIYTLNHAKMGFWRNLNQFELTRATRRGTIRIGTYIS